MCLPVIHRTHPRSRRVNIRINPRGEIIITRPRYVSRQQAQHFLRQSQPWINKQLAKINRLQHMYGLPAGKIMLLGDLHQLITIRVSTADEAHLTRRPFVLELHTASTDLRHQSVQVVDWIKQRAKLHFPPLVNRWASRTSWRPAKLSVTTMTSRWGSCSAGGRLNLNTLLYQAPPKIIEYVIVHELAHLVHSNHSAKFWNAVAQYCPDYQSHRRWLRRHNHHLLGWYHPAIVK